MSSSHGEQQAAVRRIAFAMLAALAMSGLGSTAHASTIVNSDDQPHTILIAVDAERRSETLQAKAVREGLCPDGCIVTIEGQTDATYVLQGREHVTIEGGVMYWDRQLPPAGADKNTETPESTQ